MGFGFSPWREWQASASPRGCAPGLVTARRWNTVRAVNRPGRARLASGVVLAFVSFSSLPVRAADGAATGSTFPATTAASYPVDNSQMATPQRSAAIPLPSADSDGRGEGAAEPESLGWTLFSTLLSLGAIVALIYLTLNFGLRRMMALRGLPFARAGLVKVVERVMLDSKRALFVVQAAGDYLLIGGGDEGLSLIARLDPAEVDRLLRRPEAASPQMSPFLQKLLFRKGDAPPDGRV